MTIKDIAKIYQIDRDTVSTWIRKWERDGPTSLHDQPRSGRPPKLTLEEQTLAIAYIKEEPRSLKQVVERPPRKRPSASVCRPSNGWPNEPVFDGSGCASR
jgi:transposase